MDAAAQAQLDVQPEAAQDIQPVQSGREVQPEFVKPAIVTEGFRFVEDDEPSASVQQPAVGQPAFDSRQAEAGQQQGSVGGYAQGAQGFQQQVTPTQGYQGQMGYQAQPGVSQVPFPGQEASQLFGQPMGGQQAGEQPGFFEDASREIEMPPQKKGFFSRFRNR